MGGIGGAIAGGAGIDFGSTGLGKALAAHHQRRVDEADMHRRNSATYAAVLSTGINPNTGQPLTPDERQQYQTWFDASWGAYEKLTGVSKETKAAVAKSKAVLDHIIKSGQGGQGGQATAGQGPGGSGSTPAASRPSPPPTPQATAPTGAAPTGGLPPPPSISPAVAQADAPRLARRMESEEVFGDWKRQQDVLHQHRMEEQAALQKAKAQSGTRPRPVHSGSVGVLDARRMAANGQIFMGENGEPIDVNQLDDSMGLYGMVVRNDDGKWETVYTPFSPNQRTVTVGNESYAVSPMDISKLPQGAGADIGQHNVPRTSTHEIVTVGPGGQLQTDHLTSTSTPSTPGIRGRGAASQGTAAPAGAPGATGAGASAGAKGGRRPSPPPKAPATPAAGGAGSGGKGGHPSGVPIAQYNQYLQQVRPARMAATQLFGDSANPNFKPLSDFGDLVDDAKATERIATAWNLIRDHMDQAGADPSHSGDLVTLMRNYVGTPGAVAASEAAKMEDALIALRPREATMLNRLFSTYGTIIGLRALTKGSAAKFSARNMEQEVPIPGMNVRNSKAFYDKLGTLAEEVNTGFKGLPEQVFEPGERAYDRAQQEHLSQLAQTGGKRSARPSPPPTGAPRTAEDLEREMRKGKGKGK